MTLFKAGEGAARQATTSDLSRYLSWALGKHVVVQASSPLCGGVHRNLRVKGQVEGEVCNFVLRQPPSQEASFFARQEVAPYNFETEFAVLTELQDTTLTTPKVWGLDIKGIFLGTPTFVMQFIEGPTILEAIKSQPKVVLQSFAEAIVAMNRIGTTQVTSVAKPHNTPADLISWLVEHSRGIDVPAEFRHGIEVLNEVPGERPNLAFGNGDLNPQNFIVGLDGSIAIIDWEYAGFNDPLAEIMLLHTWPPEAPFLKTFPLDRIYCELTGVDADLLPWYELYAALNNWLYAMKDRQNDAMKRHEIWMKKLLT